MKEDADQVNGMAKWRTMARNVVMSEQVNGMAKWRTMARNVVMSDGVFGVRAGGCIMGLNERIPRSIHRVLAATAAFGIRGVLCRN